MVESAHPSLRFADPRPTRRRPGHGYTRFVQAMKVLLPMLAAGLVVLLAVWSQFNLQETRFRLGVTELAPERIESLNMVNARFDGVDEKNRPYSVTAETVNQLGENADRIELSLPKADITLEDGAWVALTAERGLYGRESEVLDLAGGVSLYHDRGFEMHTARARVDLAEGVASGNAAVHGQGPAGTLDAEGFRVSDDGKRILFGGQARLVIETTGAESHIPDTELPGGSAEARG